MLAGTELSGVDDGVAVGGGPVDGGTGGGGSAAATGATVSRHAASNVRQSSPSAAVRSCRLS